MLASEKRSLRRFLAIYLSSTFLLFSLASFIFYTLAKHHLLDQQMQSLKYEVSHIKNKLRLLHQSNEQILIYPQDKNFDSAIYDLDKNYIFGTVKQKLDYKDKNFLYIVSKVEPYYLGAAYLLVKKKLNLTPINKLQKNIFIFMLIAGVFFSILGYYLGRLFVAPMREAIENINHFIQDATHELNTPISTILTNIEMIETLNRCDKDKEELKRIEIASKTLSHIHEDLTYLNLNHNRHKEIQSINLSQLLKERILYFENIFKAKKLKLSTKIEKNITLDIDRSDAIRLIDNLISNASKYNKKGGLLKIELTKEYFLVKDSGVGIKKEDLKNILKRYKRYNKSEGGFGIGLDIVHHIVKYYNFKLEISSEENKGTEVKILWQN